MSWFPDYTPPVQHGTNNVPVGSPSPKPYVILQPTSTSFTFTPAAPPSVITTYINPVTTLAAIYTRFRIVDENIANTKPFGA